MNSSRAQNAPAHPFITVSNPPNLLLNIFSQILSCLPPLLLPDIFCSNRFFQSRLQQNNHTLGFRSGQERFLRIDRTDFLGPSLEILAPRGFIEPRSPIQEASRLQLDFFDDLRSTIYLILRRRAPRQQPGLHYRSEVSYP